jgi:hypothetical protein
MNFEKRIEEKREEGFSLAKNTSIIEAHTTPHGVNII